MQQLPVEILRLIFSHLSKKDLMQCQLISEGWYRGSLEYLYAMPVTKTTEKVNLFMRTISNSSTLGNYVKFIDAFDTLDMKKILLDNDSVDTLIRQCPNIISFNRYSDGVPYWDQLLRATSQGQLSCLQYIPSPRSQTLELYLTIALNLKASLKELNINDSDKTFGYELDQVAVYQTLQDHISEFKKLESLDIAYKSNKQLSYFDSMIDSCPHLENINFYLMTEERDVITIEPDKSINICPSMREIVCSWNMIDNDSQLWYIMQKFPNLISLLIENYENRPNRIYCPYGAVTKFLTYVITKIPNFMISLEIRKVDLLPVFIGLVTANLVYTNVDIDYVPNTNNSDKVSLKITDNSIEIVFPLNDDDVEFPHVDFFSKAGPVIHSLTIQNLGEFAYYISESSPLHDAATSVDWVFEILDVCPDLQELIISEPTEAFFFACSHESQYPQVKELTIHLIHRGEESLEYFLEYISENLPNLKRLHLVHDYDYLVSLRPILINMDVSTLDLLTWENYSIKFPLESYSEVYILLSSDIGKKFYQSNETKLSEISEEDYGSKCGENLCFEIYCKSLKEFVINESLFKWSFPI